ncbi:MAG: anthranilate phosphoribosyltransferase [Armatimonadetes bacterium]|nr:anthranilate phosphoribosyltransferase [Armatimonadota bacterium]
MTVREALQKCLLHENLTTEEAQRVMSQLMLGEVHHGLIGGFLAAMQMKGLTGAELAGFVSGMRHHSLQYDFDQENLVDTCGTGGGRATFNVSTGAAILAAACGAKVAKHGNRAMTSKCGSADVLEALGVPIEGDLESQRKRMEENGLVFLFAPTHHPAMRHVAPVRKELGFRTFFNLIGPLANPANANRQVIGVYDEKALPIMAEALRILGTAHAFVVHGGDGMDEVSPSAPTKYVEVKGENITEGTWSPEDFGISPLPDEALTHGEDAYENAEILRTALTDAGSLRSQAILPTTAVTLVLAGVAGSLSEAADQAKNAIATGAAQDLLNRLTHG